MIIWRSKLVRDGIPDRIQNHGGFCLVRQLEGPSYTRALADKLVEEAKEVGRAATKEELIQELADLVEVTETFRIANRISDLEVRQARQNKGLKNGVFSKGLKLLFAFGPKDNNESRNSNSSNRAEKDANTARNKSNAAV